MNECSFAKKGKIPRKIRVDRLSFLTELCIIIVLSLIDGVFI